MLRQILNSALQRNLSLPVMSPGWRFMSSVDNINRQPPTKDDVLDQTNVRIIDYDDPDYLPVPEYPMRPDEPLEIRKQRLIYQSRKRGMLENDLLLSTFAAKYLKDLDANLTAQYDQLINGVSNDWDIFYWATKAKPTPPQYDNEIMRMLKNHTENTLREPRLRMPDLN